MRKRARTNEENDSGDDDIRENERMDIEEREGEIHGRRRHKSHWKPIFLGGFACGIGLILIITRLISGGGIGIFGRSADSQKINMVTIKEKIVNISELASVVYEYTNADSYSDSKVLFGHNVPFTQSSYVVSYDGRIKAGVDMEKAVIKLEGTKLSIDLPDAEILSNEIFQDTIKTLDESTSIFNPISISDYASFEATEKENMEKKAIDNGILKDADSRSSELVSEFVKAAIPEGYTLEIK